MTIRQSHSLLLMVSVLGVTPLASQTTQTTEVRDPGLTMVPGRCFDDNSRQVAIDSLVVMYNRIATFNLDNQPVRSEVRRGTVYVRYPGENGTAFFDPLQVAHYNAEDARVYHGLLDGTPVIVWETTVENIRRRAGILGYRGRGLYSLCSGNVPRELQDRAR